jgi:Mg-chelatase subunit ChlD
VQLALLLDNSGSMQGLIDQARSQLWAVVNHLAKTKVDGQTPRLEVALYCYGETPTQLLAFTDDLDAVSEKLFGLAIAGGDEFCGQVIRKSLDELKWSDKSGVYRTIFIAGNEPFTQGPVDYKSACEQARGRGILVNTIHCGSEAEGDQGKWADGARAGGGKYLCINKDQAIVAIPRRRTRRSPGSRRS